VSNPELTSYWILDKQCESMNWIHPVMALVNFVTNVFIPKQAENFLASQTILSSQGSFSMGLLSTETSVMTLITSH
jgi:hypothetical protein